jgi:hypothetical protein
MFNRSLLAVSDPSRPEMGPFQGWPLMSWIILQQRIQAQVNKMSSLKLMSQGLIGSSSNLRCRTDSRSETPYSWSLHAVIRQKQALQIDHGQSSAVAVFSPSEGQLFILCIFHAAE